MRGEDPKQEAMFSYVSPEQRVPQDHPLRPVREMVDTILKEMWGRFARLYSERGRPSIAPERLLRALLLQIFYSIRSERLLMEQLDYNLLFRCSWAWRWTKRCGTTRCSARTANGC
jgi:transposase